MLVRQRLRINEAVSVLALLVMVALSFLVSVRVEGALEKARIADAIMTASYERLLLRTDYYHTPGDRAKVQLVSKHAQIGALLKEAGTIFTDPEDRTTIGELLAANEATGKLSRSIRAKLEERGNSPPDPLSRELEDRRFNQLNMKIYETIMLDSRLQESSNRALVSSLQAAGGGIFLTLFLLGATAFINSRLLGRSIAGRLQLLRDGSMVIGGGELKHRIEMSGDDEFTELADSFNEMTIKLRDSYRNLETEIEERRRAEDKLGAINADLAASRSEAVKLLEQAQVARREAEQASAEFRRGNQELTLLNRAMVGRELRMIELKEEVNALCVKAGEPPRYPAGGEEQV